MIKIHSVTNNSDYSPRKKLLFLSILFSWQMSQTQQ